MEARSLQIVLAERIPMVRKVAIVVVPFPQRTITKIDGLAYISKNAKLM
jgi:hypothetical protein